MERIVRPTTLSLYIDYNHLIQQLCIWFIHLRWCSVSPFFSTSLDLRNETLHWENDEDQPKSICSEPCPAGHVHNHQDQCCWSCVKCREDSEYVKNDTCISCQPGWAPNERKNGCDKLKVEVIDWLSPWAYVSNLLRDSLIVLLCVFRACEYRNPE